MTVLKSDKSAKILVVLTGGTICSKLNSDGKRYSDAKNIRIIDEFKSSNSPYCTSVCFDTVMPMDILSENMTVEMWNTLLNIFRDKNEFKKYDGIIILHGTDTLAYTASLLSLTLAGFPIPVCLVSAKLPLDFDGTNGHANFRAATELILNGIAPNVYVIYQNSDLNIYAHYGSHLLQCSNYTDDFFSKDAMKIPDIENACLKGAPFQTDTFYLNKIQALSPCVLNISPYVGIDYNAYSLDGFKAVLHGTYHSETVCVERKTDQDSCSNYSVLHLLKRCADKDIPLFLSPCDFKNYSYESTGDVLLSGAYCISKTTVESAYVKLLLGCALNLSNNELSDFLKQSINYEEVY